MIQFGCGSDIGLDHVTINSRLKVYIAYPVQQSWSFIMQHPDPPQLKLQLSDSVRSAEKHNFVASGRNLENMLGFILPGI